MDETDKAILAVLQENARTANVAIAKKVGLTEGAVRARMERLVRDGIIRRFTIETQTGNGSRAIIMVKARDDTKTMMRGIMALKMVQQAYEIASPSADACVVVDGTDMEDIDGKIDRIRNLPSVRDTQTLIVLKRW